MTQSHMLTKFGKFLIAPGKGITGELRVAGTDSELYLRDDESFSPFAPDDACITGILHDLTKVSLLGCITLQGPGLASIRGAAQYHYARLFPHFVLTGQCHIGPNDRIVSQNSFFIEDAPELFYDFDAFGTVIDSRPHIDNIATANGLDRPIPIGPEPKIVYFAGKREIVRVETVFGVVRTTQPELVPP